MNLPFVSIITQQTRQQCDMFDNIYRYSSHIISFQQDYGHAGAGRGIFQGLDCWLVY